MLLFALLLSAAALDPPQLRGVRSIACLQLLLKDPAANCAHPEDRVAPTVRGTPGTQGQWFTGTGGFPVPDAVMGMADPRPCSSGGEYFCDPDGVLSPEAQEAVRADLRFVRENTLVSCPIPWIRAHTHTPNAARPDDEVNYLLGVAVLRTLTATTDEALQDFGESVMESWQLDGSCDRSALLIIVADVQKVWLATRTCRFLCAAAPQGEENVEAPLEGGQRVLNALKTDGSGKDWAGRLQEAIRIFNTVLAQRKGVERTHAMPQETRLKAYLRRKEKEWHTMDVTFQYMAYAAMVVAAICTFVWHWQWVKASVPWGAQKLAEDEPLGGIPRIVCVNVAAVVMMVPLLAYWTLQRGWSQFCWACGLVADAAYSVGHQTLDAGTACLAVAMEPCLRLLEPAEQALDTAVEPLPVH